MTPEEASASERPTQADRRARARTALIKVAAREFSRFGYVNAKLERVANELSSSAQEGSTAGDAYSRPEVYDLFANKEELALAVVQWAAETWYEEVGSLFAKEADPVATLLAVARGHAVYCRQDVPRVMTTLKAEFEGDDHPVGRAVNEALGRVIDDLFRLITAGRRSGAIPPGPPPRELALAYLGALDGVVRPLRGQAPLDILLAEKVALGLLGLAPTSGAAGTE